MGQVNDRIPAFVYLMKHIVTKQANHVSITGFRPPEFVAEAVNDIRQKREKIAVGRRTPDAR